MNVLLFSIVMVLLIGLYCIVSRIADRMGMLTGMIIYIALILFVLFSGLFFAEILFGPIGSLRL